ncbi:MAG: cytidine deaminase [Bacteroidaceae bacterium]|nr:cytidine deaminase [Bacteroidaceae bacterium]
MKKIVHECHYALYNFNELSASDQNLITQACEATTRSYSPYSHFGVGAAALLDDGTIVTGSNQENAAFPSGLCAERTTLFYANSQHPDKAVVALAVAARDSQGLTRTPTPPCGACRQVILETETRFSHPIRILLYGTEGIYVVDGGIRELLPLIFTGDFLK